MAANYKTVLPDAQVLQEELAKARLLIEGREGRTANERFRTRVARADLAAFDKIMARSGGVPPREGDKR